MNHPITITIDGPAGVGKGTVAKSLAKKLEFDYLDTGAMYRAVALAAINSNVDLKNNVQIENLIKSISIEIKSFNSENFKIHLNSTDITNQIRTEQVSSVSSEIATNKPVREFLVNLQRKIGLNNDLVVEGRDMGTYVFPNAKFKFYLDADPKERAKRRYLQLLENNPKINFEKVLKDVLERDKTDMEREESPLHPAPNAVIIDTTNLTVSEVVGLILERINFN